MKSISINIVVSILLVALIGCSGFDSIQVLTHPDTVQPSETFDVAVLNLYSYLANGTTVPAEVVRDSLHLLAGVPEGWEVIEAKMAIVDDMPVTTLFALQESVFDETAMTALLEQYKAQAVPVAEDAALQSALSGQTFTAHSVTADTDIDVAIDNVPVWKGFSAPVTILLEAGSKTDTGIVLDSMLALASATGTVDDSMKTEIEAMKGFPGVPDTFGVTMVPIALYLKVKAGTEERNDTLFYFSKTAEMNPEPTQTLAQMMPEMTDLEMGDMTYVPVSVSNASGVQRGKTGNRFDKPLAIHTVGRSVHISLHTKAGADRTVALFNLQGNLINSLRIHSGQSSVIWNGNDLHGAAVGNGTYLVKVAVGSEEWTTAIQFVR